MNKESYVKAVAKRLTCSKARQAEFVRDLESDIAAALSAGETWEQVESRMRPASGGARVQRGSLRSGASRRQETQAHQDDSYRGDRRGGNRRDRRRGRMVAAPKLSPAGQSSNLGEQQVIEQAQKVAEVVGEGDYDKLRPMLDDAAAERSPSRS